MNGSENGESEKSRKTKLPACKQKRERASEIEKSSNTINLTILQTIVFFMLPMNFRNLESCSL